jgi:hypothetical protein
MNAKNLKTDSKFDATRGLWLVGEPTPAASKKSAPKAKSSERRVRNSRVRSSSKKASPPVVPASVVDDEPIDPKFLSVLDQVKMAFQMRNVIGTVVGFLFGGVVPYLTFKVVHSGIKPWVDFGDLLIQPCAWLAMGGLLYSAITVYAWGVKAFRMGLKAFGFVVLMEGTMTVIPHDLAWLAYIPLVYLIVINGIATGCIISLDRKPTF